MLNQSKLQKRHIRNILERRLKTTAGENLKSAVGAVMSRNGSHNIGSHVLSSLSHQIGTMPDDRSFYQYIQQRMGYIANVTTRFPDWMTPTLFVGDMMRTFFFQRHLLEYIADSEGLHAYCFRDSNGVPCTDRQQTGTIKLYVRRVDRGDETKVKHFISYHQPETDASIPFSKDVSLAIPGGVVGQHAFFTILENIIRNAAKHGWATKTDDEKKSLENLEIHISFEVAKNDDTIEFTIWDNASDVFSPFLQKDESPRDENGVRSFLDALCGVEKSPVLKGSSPDRPITRANWIDDIFGLFLKKRSSFQECWENAKRNDMFDSFFRTPLNGNELEKLGTIDFKSGVPLHMQQEILLNQQIVEDGVLQRENWGMAEMRVSAGYLRSLSLAEICGFRKLQNDDYIIRAIAVEKKFGCPDNTAGDKTCSASNCQKHGSSCPMQKRYHLGYRFKVRKSREMLIVVNEPGGGSDSEKEQDLIRSIRRFIPQFKQDGIYFAKIRNDGGNGTENVPVWISADGPSQDIFAVRSYHFDYVVFPTEESAKNTTSDRHWRSHFPFRLLVGDGGGNDKTHPVRIAYDELINVLSNVSDQNIPKTVLASKNIVYRDWLKSLKAPYMSENKPLSMLVKTNDKERTGNSLFSNYDLYRFIFNHCFSSIVDAKRSECNANTLFRLAMPEKQSFRNWSEIMPDQTDLSLTHMGLKGDLYKIIRTVLEKRHLYFNVNERDILSAMETAYVVCDAMLRRKTNCCTTLPPVYVEDTEDETEEGYPYGNDAEQFQIGFLDIVQNETDGDIPVKYQRHLVTECLYPDCIYAEQLSGTQSYFNTLMNISNVPEQKKVGLFVRMAENALLRILIIDERVSKFLTEHPHMQAVFYNMNIFAADYSMLGKEETVGVTGDGKDIYDIDLEKLPLFLPFDKPLAAGKTNKWDILILHQGVIDKLFFRHSQNEVGKLMNNLRKKAAYPIITSGRGRPDNIPSYIRVLPFSTVESTLFNSCPEKMLLTATIMNLLSV